MPSHFIPWNKGKLVGQTAPLRLTEFGPFVCVYNRPVVLAIWRCLT